MSTRVRIEMLANGCYSYKMDATDNRFFPGQEDPNAMGTEASGFLAKCLFTDANGHFPVSAFAAYEEEMLAGAGGDGHAIVDCFLRPMPILYFPADRRAASLADQFAPDDNYARTSRNAAYLTPYNVGSGYSLRDPNVTRNRQGEFLLIGAGPDRKYFTADDIRNW